MALYGLLGDIHGNLEALEAALAALDAQGVDRVLCVGDIVGYNADANRCVEILRERGALCILGNHDLIGTRRLGFERCSNKAMHSLQRTRRSLCAEAIAYLNSLPSHRVIEGDILLTHGGVRDVQQYMTRERHVVENVDYLRKDFPGTHVCFYGHTHEQRVWEVDGTRVSEPYAAQLSLGSEACVTLRRDRQYFVNPGSVDASRKRTHKLAELAILDSDTREIRFQRVPYDERSTEAKAQAAGFRINRWRDRAYDWQRRLIGPRQETAA